MTEVIENENDPSDDDNNVESNNEKIVNDEYAFDSSDEEVLFFKQ